MIARGNHGHVPNPTALKKNPAEHEGRRRRAVGATGRRNRIVKCQSLLTFLTRPSLTRRIASQPAKHTTLGRHMLCVLYAVCAWACAAGQRTSTDLRWPAQAHAPVQPKSTARCCALGPSCSFLR